MGDVGEKYKTVKERNFCVKMKKIILSIIALTILCLTFSTVASASFGSGVLAIANECEIIKSGLSGRKITFSDADIKQGLCITDFDSIKITKLPASTEGTLLIAGRRVAEGATIKRKNLPALVFIPASRDVKEAEFGFTVDGYASGCEVIFKIKFADKVNYEPEIIKDEKKEATLSTQREISAYGKLAATDKEGDAIEFIVVSYPKFGTLKLDKTSGEYSYTPNKSYTGTDSFTYVARDEWGNFSKTDEISLTVTERMSEVIYRDMKDRREYGAAVTMTAMGVMGGKVMGDGMYFNPDEAVTKAEFVSMAMKALGYKADSSLTKTYFDDNDKIPEPLISYIATAQKLGFINGNFKDGKLVFEPTEKITKYEAAVILARIAGLKSKGDKPVFEDIYDIPVWAREDVYAMCSIGVFDSSESKINGTVTLTRADCAVYICNMLSGK